MKGDEMAALVGVLQEWVTGAVRGLAGAEPDPAAEGRADDGDRARCEGCPACPSCPVCRTIRLLRETGPEPVERLVAAAGEFVTSFVAALGTRDVGPRPAAPEKPEAVAVQHIPVRVVPSEGSGPSGAPGRSGRSGRSGRAARAAESA